jgi:hypothetical protein
MPLKLLMHDLRKPIKNALKTTNKSMTGENLLKML